MTSAAIPLSVTVDGVSYAVTGIGRGAFTDCKTLKVIKIPNSIIHIDDYAFDYTGLTSFVIPGKVSKIGKSAFEMCSDLKAFYVEETNLHFCADDGVLFNKGLTTLIYYPGGKKGSYTIPNSVTTIAYGAFSGNYELTELTIPSSVTKIGECAFTHSKRLKAINVSPDNPNFCSIDGVLYNKEKTKLIACPSGKSGTFVVPLTVKTIGDRAFCGNDSLTQVIMQNQVTAIEDAAFYNCRNLKTIVLPPSIKNIGQNAFETSWRTTVYTNSTMSIPSGTSYSVSQVSEEELLLYYQFSDYSYHYVSNKLREWQQKGEFERTSDWQQRVTEQTRNAKIDELIAEAEKKYIAHHLKSANYTFSLGTYDADNEEYPVINKDLGVAYVSVPLTEAKDFKDYWDWTRVSYQLKIVNNEFRIASLNVRMPTGKYTSKYTDEQYTNKPTTADVFSPLKLEQFNVPSKPTSTPPKSTLTPRQPQASVVDKNIPETGASNPNTFVLIFANEHYKYVASVPYALNDGTIFQQYCIKTLGIPQSNIHYIEDASKNDIEIQLAWLHDVCDAFDGKASVILYYAGHGMHDDKTEASAYLLPADGDGRYMVSAYKLENLYNKLAGMKAKTITVFMDACFSGAKRGEGMITEARGIAYKVNPSDPQGKMVVFSAAQGNETAYPDKDQQHGMFTYYLLKKLQESKGDVTLKALGDYIITNVRQQSIVKNGKSQTPTVMSSKTLGNDWKNWKLK